MPHVDLEPKQYAETWTGVDTWHLMPTVHPASSFFRERRHVIRKGPFIFLGLSCFMLFL